MRKLYVNGELYEYVTARDLEVILQPVIARARAVRRLKAKLIAARATEKTKRNRALN